MGKRKIGVAMDHPVTSVRPVPLQYASSMALGTMAVEHDGIYLFIHRQNGNSYTTKYGGIMLAYISGNSLQTLIKVCAIYKPNMIWRGNLH